MLSFLVFAAALWGLSRAYPTRMLLAGYFFWQAVFIVSSYLLARIVGVPTLAYTVCYCLLSIPIYRSIGRIAWEVLRGRRYRARPLVISAILAAGMGYTALLGISRYPHSLFSYLAVVQGFCLLWAGLVLGGVAAHLEQKAVHYPLALLWMAQGVFNLGFGLHLPAWLGWPNWVIQPLLAAAAFVVIGWRLKLRPRTKFSCAANTP